MKDFLFDQDKSYGMCDHAFFIILLEGHQTYSVYLATIWSQDYQDLEAQ